MADAGMVLLGRSEAEWQTAGGILTAREIMQQPDVWKAMVLRLGSAFEEVRAWLSPFIANPAAQIIFTGAGTSAYVGESVAAHLRGRLSCHVQAIATTDIVSSPDVLGMQRPTLLVSFARSGNSPESLEAVNIVRIQQAGCRFLNIHCNESGALAVQNADQVDTLNVAMPAASCDGGFAMTSSYSTMLLAALVCFSSDYKSAAAQVTQVADVARDLLKGEHSLFGYTLASESFKRLVYLGSGPLTAVAREGALKVLELTAGRLEAIYESSLGLRHGPKAFVNDETLVCVMLSSDAHTRQYDLDIIRELRTGTRACRVIVVSPVPLDDTLHARNNDLNIVLPLADLAPAWTAPVMVTLLQQLALQQSMRMVLTPDNPFPDGSVNRVVQGVRIHPYLRGSEAH
ncbi:SIS domain-containing protein [Burkholderiaceae bacterium DAT-1]|nr:SIS domain-containing protein [Burkholderiaceae bacterium DAT-1]